MHDLRHFNCEPFLNIICNLKNNEKKILTEVRLNSPSYASVQRNYVQGILLGIQGKRFKFEGRYFMLKGNGNKEITTYREEFVGSKILC